MLLELIVILLGHRCPNLFKTFILQVATVVSSTMERFLSDNPAPSSTHTDDAAVKKAEPGPLSMHIKESLHPNERDPHSHSVYQHIISGRALPSKISRETKYNMKYSNAIAVVASLATFYSQAVKARAILDKDLMIREVADNACVTVTVTSSSIILS